MLWLGGHGVLALFLWGAASSSSALILARMDTPKPRGTRKPALNASTMHSGSIPCAGHCDSAGVTLSLVEGVKTR